MKGLGSRFFTSDDAIGLGMGCEVWRGYYQSARQGWKKVLLNINMASSVFLRGMPVLEYLYEITEHDVRVNQGPLSDGNREKFEEEIKSMLQSAFFERSYAKSFYVVMQKSHIKVLKNQGFFYLNHVVATFIILPKKKKKKKTLNVLISWTGSTVSSLKSC